MRRLIPVFLFFLGPAFLVRSPDARAEEKTAKAMHLNLSQCIDIALKNNSQVIQGRFNVEIAGAQVDNARRAFLPSISSNYGIVRSITGPREGSIVDPATGTLITSLGQDHVSGSQSVGASLSMPIYNPADLASLSASKRGVQAARMTLAETRQAIIFQVKQRYFNLLQALKLLSVQQEQVRVSEESLRRNETLYEIGSAPISDMYSARSQVEQDKATLIVRENAVEIARSNLSFSLGLPPDANIVPSEEEFEVKPLSITYEEALRQALGSHPDLLSRKYAMMQSRDQLKATRYGVRFPTVSASAGYGWTLAQDEKFRGLEDLFVKNYSYSFRLSVNLPIFNGLSTENQVKIDKLRYLESQEQLDQAKRQTALNIKQAFLNIEQLRRSITANQAAVLAAEQAFKLQDERYNFGAGTFLERSQAQLNLFSARNQLVQVKYNYQIELARLEQAMGGPLKTSENR